MKKMTNRIRVLGVLFGISLPMTALASTVSFTSSVPFATTDWSELVSVSQFDTSLGTLQSVTFQVNTYLESSFVFESTDKKPATITGTVSGTITLEVPVISLTLQSTPTAQKIVPVTAYDHTIDFGGFSGRTFDSAHGNALTSTDSATITPVILDFTPFEGLGTLTLPVYTSVASTATGTGNLLSGFDTGASADVTVTYTYTSIPTPSAIWAGGMILAGVVTARLRRKMQA